MKKIFAKENEKFVNNIVFNCHEEDSVYYFVDKNGNKLDPDVVYDLFKKGLILIEEVDDIGPISLVPCRGQLFDYEDGGSRVKYAAIGFIAVTNDVSPSIMWVYSDGYTTG